MYNIVHMCECVTLLIWTECVVWEEVWVLYECECLSSDTHLHTNRRTVLDSQQRFARTQTIVSRFRLGMNKLELNANPQVRLTSMIDILGVSVSPHLLPLLVRFHEIRTPPPLFGYTRMVTDLLNLHPQHVDVDVVLSGCSAYSSLLNSNND